MSVASLFPVFEWEISFVQFVASWKHSGFIYELFHACSDWYHARWLALIGVGLLFWLKGWRQALYYLAPLVVAVGFSDFTSYHFVKAFIMRPRPHFLGQACAESACWGFISSHAANITAAATIFTLKKLKNVCWAAPIALAVCFSRIYLADHYPLDVIGGMLLGFAIAIIVDRAFNKFNYSSALSSKDITEKNQNTSSSSVQTFFNFYTRKFN